MKANNTNDITIPNINDIRSQHNICPTTGIVPDGNSIFAVYEVSQVIKDLYKNYVKKNVEKVIDKLKQKIEQKYAQFGSVTTKEIRGFIQQEIGELYSIRHVERIMHKRGFSLITPRTMHTKHDQSAVYTFVLS